MVKEFINDFINIKGTTFPAWNKGNQKRNDGVDIEICTDKITNGYQVSFIEDGEWLQYTFDLKIAQTFDVNIRFASEMAGGILYLENESGIISDKITIPSTGGLNKWKTITLKNVKLSHGINKVKVHFEKGGFNLNYFDFK